ncbi:MAG: hypothetical protein CMA67_00200 [Euryarchaeota archaeon]|nr:hypothetical protein [Euryarchaeota archaeon]|tara:strand:- start:639 stop:875 length:237 start_codon:yes stop_codon:yes gene_type:complete
MSDGVCVKCGAQSLNESLNARIRGGLQMISCKECGFVEFYLPKGKESLNNLKDGIKHTGLILLAGVGFLILLAILASL